METQEIPEKQEIQPPKPAEDISPVGKQAMQGPQDAPDSSKPANEIDTTGSIGESAEVKTIPPDKEVFLDELEPNSVYEKNGYTYKTDEQGRPVLVSGKLHLGEGVRTKQQTDIGHMGEEDDVGGHLVGTRFEGPPDAFNIRPQNAELNDGEWKKMENEWAKALKDGQDVDVLIEPIYEDKSIRPSQYEVVYQINGRIYSKIFENQA